MQLINMVCKKISKGKSAEEIAYDLDEDIDMVREICKAAADEAPLYDANKIFDKMKKNSGA